MTDPREIKMQEILNEGKSQVIQTIDSIRDEYQKRIDVIARPSSLDYKVIGTGIYPLVKGDEFMLTDFARNQLLGRVQMPTIFYNRLMDLEEHDLIRYNLNRLTERMMEDGVLIRRVGQMIKGWLSSAYKRMDGTPIIEAFVTAAVKAGFVPLRGNNTDYRYQIIFVYPQTFHPTVNEWILYGIALTTSDYGASALDLSLTALRITCINLAIGYDMFRKVHIGSRFHAEKDYIELSKKTLELDSRTIASAVGDVVERSVDHITELDNLIKKATEKEINNVAIYWETFKKKGMKKEVLDKVKAAWDMPEGIEVLPANHSLWRLSNCLSLIAQEVKKKDEQIDLEKMAMDIMVN